MKNNKLYNVWRQIIYRCSENYFQKHLYFDKPIKKGKYKRVNFDIETMKNKINGKR